MNRYDSTPEFFDSWEVIRNHLIKKFPQLGHFDMEYVKGRESGLLNRILLLTGIDEYRLKREINEALRNHQKQKVTGSSYHWQ